MLALLARHAVVRVGGGGGGGVRESKGVSRVELVLSALRVRLFRGDNKGSARSSEDAVPATLCGRRRNDPCTPDALQAFVAADPLAREPSSCLRTQATVPKLEPRDLCGCQDHAPVAGACPYTVGRGELDELKRKPFRRCSLCCPQLPARDATSSRKQPGARTCLP